MRTLFWKSIISFAPATAFAALMGGIELSALADFAMTFAASSP